MNHFFDDSDILDYEVLRPLSHITLNWELSWDINEKKYITEEDSFAGLLNELIDELESANPPRKYHDNEDRLAENVKRSLGWNIQKRGKFWVGADYDSIIEQGGFNDINEADLVLAAAGRIKAAQDRGQNHYDEMEQSHRRMLAAVITIILYHRDYMRHMNA
jgi:hypothetical protein